MEKVSELAIIGPGLLGGSLALAMTQSTNVRLWGRSAVKLKSLEGQGFSIVSTDLERVISGAEFIVLAIPVPYMKDIIQQMLDCGLQKEQLITDVGSVKGAVVRELQPLLGERGYSFIGSHPMTGSETAGFQAAQADLFRGASCIITPDEWTRQEQLTSVQNFWKAVGMKTFLLPPQEHDDIVSRVSHIPHLLASVCAHVALPQSTLGQYAGGGLRDTSRVAAGDAHLWAGILSENKEALLPHISEVIVRLQQYQSAIESGDDTVLESFLSEDKNRRDSASL